MAKRTRRRARPVKPIRQAAPRRLWFALTRKATLIAGVLGCVAGAAMLPFGTAAAVAALVAVIAIAGLRFKRRTVLEWITVRRRHRRPLEQAIVFDRDGVGYVFDGVSLRVLLQLTPRPWQVTVVGRDQVADLATVPVDALRSMLVQGDIRLSRIVAVCSGHKYVVFDHAAAALDASIGTVPFPLGGQTVLEAHLDVDPVILNAAYIRAHRVTRDGEPSLPDGLFRAGRAAAMRLRRHLASHDFEAHVMSAQAIRDLNVTNLGQLAQPIASRRWKSLGDPQNVHTRSYTPSRRYWNEDAAASWNHVPAHRQYTAVVVTPTDDGNAAAVQPVITYLAADGHALDDVETLGLHREGGMQAAAASLALPGAVRPPLQTTAVAVDDRHAFGFGIPAGGVGMYVGTTGDGDRIFVSLPTGGAGEPLWLCGPKQFAQHVVARASTLHSRIAVQIDDEDWRNLINFRRSPLLSYGDKDPNPDVVVCDPQWWEMNRTRTRGRAVILVTDGDPGLGASHYLQVQAPTELNQAARIHVHVDDTDIRLPWRLPEPELRALLGQSPTATTQWPVREPAGAR